MNIIKRSGAEVPFDKEKIAAAMGKANASVDETERIPHERIRGIADWIEGLAASAGRAMSVEEIQDRVEEALMSDGFFALARNYITYRYEHAKMREDNEIFEKLTASNVQNQNANVDERSFGGRMGETMSLVSKRFALEHLLSPMARHNHINNEIYIHDLDHYALGDHNCFLRTTRFVTEDGVRSFSDYHDGDKISVLNKDGSFVPATVRLYGRQPMQEVTFSRFGTELTKVCTKNHRWILADGSVTTDIRVGDKILCLEDKADRTAPASNREKDLFALGFVIGDGCDHNEYVQVRLCNKKIQYQSLLEDAGYNIVQRFSNGCLLMKRAAIHKQVFLTNQIWKILSPRDKACIFEGFYAADGYQTTASYHVATSDERILEMVKEISVCAGFHVTHVREVCRSTNYKDNAHLWVITLSRGQRNNSLWTVKKIEKGNHRNSDYEAWCLEEPLTNSFVLEGGIITGNCLSIPFDKLLADGFDSRACDVRPAGSADTAMQLVAVIFQLQSLQQFGGVSATHLDWTMVPYVRLSFWKHYRDGHRYISHALLEDKPRNEIKGLSVTDLSYYNDGEAYNYAMDMTTRELEQAVEGLYHNLNTLQSRSGCQLPFTSINYGTCTLPEGRMVIKALLDGSIKGVGKFHKTPIFPCGIFQCMKGVNRKHGDPNYDLFRLALKSTSLRLYPNYANVDWSNAAGYDPENPQTYFSTMGALAGHEHLYVRIDGGDPIDISIKDFFHLCNGTVIKGRPMQLYYNQPPMNVDTDPNWRHNQSRYDDCVKDGAGVYKVTYIPQDVSYIGSSRHLQQRIRDHKKCIRHRGGLDSGVNFSDTDLTHYRFEIIEYTDDYEAAEKRYILDMPNINFRGIKAKYYKNVGLSREKGLVFRPDIVMNPAVPQDFIDLSDSNIMVLDRDNKWVKVLHVFRNDKMNTPLMMHISYKEFDKVYTLCCTEDHPLWTGDDFTVASKISPGDFIYRGDGMRLEVTDVRYCVDRKESYDIGTESGSFIGSDVIMHNCRTANLADINADDPNLAQLKDGRGNICPVSLILPELAMQSKERAEASGTDIVEDFMAILDRKIMEAKDMLIERFDWICSQSPASARFMYENGTMYGYKPEEGIRSALKHGTLAIGHLGLAETLQILVGCDHTEEKGMALAKRIEQLFKDRCAEFKQKYKLNFGVYYTPAENLCYTSMQKFQAKHGIIPKVSDKEFWTNSIHVPVWHKMTPFEKIDIESQLTGYSSAGCITYVEMDTSVQNNLDSLEDLVNYAMDKDIPYFAINVPADTCEDCGYQGDIPGECPKCGSENIQRLRRVTGYLTGNFKTAFNSGKIQETEMREKHNGVEA